MSVSLTLGPITFQDFEIPEKINFGGAQRLVTHKLTGGDRVIDAMGRDDSDIRWSGRFRGWNAENRARQLDFLRQQGDPLELSWAAFRYTVVISQFEAEFQQYYEIPYSITCTVATDETFPILPLQQGLDQIFGGDLGLIGTLAAVLDIQNINSAVENVQNVLAVVGTVSGMSGAQQLSMLKAIDGAQSLVTSNINSLNQVTEATGGVAGVISGAQPTDLAGSLTGQYSAFSQLGSLYQINAALTRMSSNLRNQ